MNEFIQNNLQTRLYNWLMRRTTNSAVRRIGELPLAIGSDIGLERGENQDRVAVLRMQHGRDRSFIIAALCDGMGGMEDGSACASQAIASFFMACIRNGHIPAAQRVILAAQNANQHIHSLYKGRGGTTLSAVLLESIVGMVGVNVGDSRIYVYQENKLDQITIDDTMTGLLKNNLHQRNELLQFIGIGDGLEPHAVKIPRSHESIILTSDGVHFIDKQIMQMVIQGAKDSALTVRRLIEIAKWCGGRDNASVVALMPLLSQSPLFDDPGAIRIWDPFGDLQLIISEAADIGRIDNKPPEDRKPVASVESEKSKRSAKPAGKKKSARKRKPAKRGIADKVAHRKKDPETKKEGPQLKIYFNGDTGKDKNG